MQWHRRISAVGGRALARVRRRDATRYGYLHIAKTGGTSINATIQHARMQGFHPPRHLGHAFTLRRALEKYPRIRLAVTIRDPIERIVSAFDSRRRQSRPSYTALWSAEEAIGYLWFPTVWDFFDAKLSDDERMKSAALFVERHFGHIHRGYRYHFESVDFLRANRDRFYFVGHIDTLSENFWRYFEPTDVPAALLETRPTRLHARPAAEGAPTARSADFMRRLRGVYDEEYRLYEYLRELSETTR